MGILKSGPFGPIQNKTGPLVGRCHRKQNVVSALPHPSDKPFTAAQLESQLKFGLLNGFLSDIDQLVNIGFSAAPKNNSPVNKAFSYNYKHAFVKSGDTFLIDYPKMIYSRGHIVIPESPQVTVAAGNIAFSWLLQKQSAYCQFTDLASFLIYNPAKAAHVILLNVTNRYTQHYSLPIPPDYAGDTVHCYMNFTSTNGKQTGNSKYIAALAL